MRLYDPTVPGPEQNSIRAPVLAGLEGKTVGLLENGKLNAAAMMQEIGTLFAARHGCTIAPLYAKSNASAPAPAGTLRDAAGKVDLLITGLGD